LTGRTGETRRLLCIARPERILQRNNGNRISVACHWRAPRSADSDGRSRCRVPWRQEMRGLRLLSTSLPSPRHVSIQDSPDRRCASDRVRRARRELNVCRRRTSCRMRRDAYQDEVCLATEAQQDETVEEITVEVVDPFIAAYRTYVDELLGGPQKFSLYCHPLRLHCMYL